MSEQDYRFRAHGDKALASHITAIIMPDLDVSERTESTYRVGAQIVLSQLAGGDWGSSLGPEFYKQLMEEFLGRVVANAERQGFPLDINPREQSYS